MKSLYLQKAKPYLFIAPALLIFLIFSIYPILNMIQLSFYEWDLIAPEKLFVGFKNFISLFHDTQFRQTLSNTFVYMFCTVGFSLLFSIALALFLKKDTRVNRILQSLVFSPYIVSLASISMLWMWLMNNDFGLLNYVLSLFHIDAQNWLGNTNLAMPSLIMISVWKSLGYNTLIMVASLQAIPKHLYEAAALDNAGRLSTLRKITLPMISPTVFFITIVNVINSFKVFETIQIMTQGGPTNSTNTLVYSIYEYGFQFYKIGYASAIGVILLILVAIMTFFYFKALSKKVHYQ